MLVDDVTFSSFTSKYGICVCIVILFLFFSY